MPSAQSSGTEAGLMSSCHLGGSERWGLVVRQLVVR